MSSASRRARASQSSSSSALPYFCRLPSCPPPLCYLQAALDRSASSTAWRELRDARLGRAGGADALGSAHGRNSATGSGPSPRPRRHGTPGDVADTAESRGRLSGGSDATRSEAFREVAVGAFLAEAAEHLLLPGEGSGGPWRKLRREAGTEEEPLTAASFVADWVGFIPDLLNTHVAPFFADGTPLPGPVLRRAVWDARFGPLGSLEQELRSVQAKSATAEGRPQTEIQRLARSIVEDLLRESTEDELARLAVQRSATAAVVLVHLLPVSAGAEGGPGQAFRPESVAYAYLSDVATASRVVRMVFPRSNLAAAGACDRPRFRLRPPSPDVTSPDSAVGMACQVLRGLSHPLREALVDNLSGWIPNPDAVGTPELDFLTRTFGLFAVTDMSQKAAAKAAVAGDAVVWRFWTAEEMVSRWLLRGFIGVLADECAIYVWDQCLLHGFDLMPIFAAVVLQMLEKEILNAADLVRLEAGARPGRAAHWRSAGAKKEDDEQRSLATIRSLATTFLLTPRRITLADLVEKVMSKAHSTVVKNTAVGGGSHCRMSK